jgi:hypothetical protein
MKKLFHSILLLMMFALFTWQLTACKRTPSPPSEQDAIAVWKYTHRNLHTQELQSLTKTNGQLQEANGGYVYTLYYEAKVKDIVQLGNRAPGTVESYQSNYAFQWTEKGWMGPDKQVYPEH